MSLILCALYYLRPKFVRVGVLEITSRRSQGEGERASTRLEDSIVYIPATSQFHNDRRAV